MMNVQKKLKLGRVCSLKRLKEEVHDCERFLVDEFAAACVDQFKDFVLCVWKNCGLV